jgi:hypothetical protein
MLRLLVVLLALCAAGVANAANTCFITEFAAYPPPLYQAAHQIPLAEQTVAIGGTSTASSAFQTNTVLVRIVCDASASFEFGTAPTATTSTALLPSGVIEYFIVPAGQGFKVAVISNS